MRNLRQPDLPDTHLITDPETLKYAKALNVELDGFRREINKYVGKVVTTSLTAATTLTASDDVVLASGTFTITLPIVASTAGKTYFIKNIGTGTITIDGASTETIDGETTITLSSQYDFVVITSDGSEWHIIADMAMGRDRTWTGQTFYEDDSFIVFDKSSGNGIKVDTTTPTFGFADLLGDQFSKNTGATKPTLATYNGATKAWQFSNGDEAYLSYHIPHDYVPSTDIHLHVHWSQNNAGATGGTVDFKYFAIYAKGHNQASGSAFTSTPITATFSSIDINDGGSGLNQYQQHFTEVTISAASATVALFDRDNFEPDGVIELTLEMDATNLTGTPSDPFIHYVDIHYQTTGLIGTKSRTPDFYA